jgi:hypothetical protein
VTNRETVARVPLPEDRRLPPRQRLQHPRPAQPQRADPVPVATDGPR